MRHPLPCALLAGSVLLVSACGGSKPAAVSRAIDTVNAVDQRNVAELMLKAGNPDEAVRYFKGQLEDDPDNLRNRRGLARSLIRAGRVADAIPEWRTVADHPEATRDDRVMLAEAHLRANDWEAGKAVLDSIPPTHESFDRYRLEAMIADSQKDWDKADHFYETAAGLTTTPANDVLENDTDPGNDALSAAASTLTTPQGAEVTIQTDGSFTYDPTLQDLFIGQTATDTFTYTAYDGAATRTAQVTLTLHGALDPGTGAVGEVPAAGFWGLAALAAALVISKRIAGR